MNIKTLGFEILSVCAVISGLVAAPALAEVTFVSATNALTLVDTITEGSQKVFVFRGIADGDSADISFATDGACPGVAMTGGAEFSGQWSCASGAIAVAVTNRGGMSFGPATEANEGTFYVTFSDPPAPPGSDTAPAELSGIQIAVYGDVSSWDLTGSATASGASFGVSLTGTKGGDAHFRMTLPQAAADYLGGVLGVFVGGKADPFATVTTNENGSVSISVDIASLSSTSGASASAQANTVTKKITAGARSLSVGFNKSSTRPGKAVTLAMCSGATFTAGDSVAIKFTVGGKAAGLKKSFTVGTNGCASTSVKLKAALRGTLTAAVAYQGSKAKGTIKISK